MMERITRAARREGHAHASCDSNRRGGSRRRGGDPDVGWTGRGASAAEPAVPTGFQRIVDDTGTISAAVLEGWSVDTARFNVGHDGVGFPSITASPGRTPAACDGCLDGWLLPMFEVVAEPYRNLSMESSCDHPETVPFDSGSFAGVRRNGVGCDMWMDEVLASEAGGALNIRVDMIYAGPLGSEEPAMPVEEAKALFDVMLQHIEWTGSPYPSAPAATLPSAALAALITGEVGADGQCCRRHPSLAGGG